MASRRIGRTLRSAFTLVEVLVATTITLIIMTIVGMALQSTSQAVEVTVANQDISTYAAGMANMLREDFRRLRNDGFMVIKTQSVQPYTTYDSKAPEYTTDRYNIDQITFFASGPWTSQKYTGATMARDIQADLARVWYGHVAANRNASAAVGFAFQPQFGSNGAAGSPPTGLSQQVQWLLGRHALLLPNSAVTGAPTSIWQHRPVAGVAGITDGEFDAVDGANSLATILAQAQSVTVPSGYDNTRVLYPATKTASPYDWAGGATIEKQHEAFGQACYRVYGTRFIQAGSGNSDIRALAQLASNVAVPFCSDFKVEFAGDFNDTADSGVPDGQVDIETIDGDPQGDITVVPSSPVFWYGGLHRPNHPTKSYQRRYVEPVLTYGGADAPSGTNPINFFQTDAQYVPYTAVFGPDHTVTPWPKLVRVTVVLHDEHGRFHQRYMLSKSLPDGRSYQFILEVP